MRRFWCRIISYLLVAALSVAIFPSLAGSVLVHSADNNLNSVPADELYNQGIILFNSGQFKDSKLSAVSTNLHNLGQAHCILSSSVLEIHYYYEHC